LISSLRVDPINLKKSTQTAQIIHEGMIHGGSTYDSTRYSTLRGLCLAEFHDLVMLLVKAWRFLWRSQYGGQFVQIRRSNSDTGSTIAQTNHTILRKNAQIENPLAIRRKRLWN